MRSYVKFFEHLLYHTTVFEVEVTLTYCLKKRTPITMTHDYRNDNGESAIVSL